jgi:hypothetical protein
VKTALSIVALAAAALIAGCNSPQTSAAAPGAVGDQPACSAQAKTCGAACAKSCCAKAAPGAISGKAAAPACCPSKKAAAAPGAVGTKTSSCSKSAAGCSKSAAGCPLSGGKN